MRIELAESIEHNEIGGGRSHRGLRFADYPTDERNSA